MTKKEEGKITDCFLCGEELICHSVEYQGNSTLQWQNEDGTAHYKFISKGNYECKTSETAASTNGISAHYKPTVAFTPSMKIEEQRHETLRLYGKFEELVKSGELQEGTTPYEVMKLYIRTLGLCDSMGITDEIKRGMLSNQANIRACSG